jgi:uncharacterized repeat protein (TIGR03847 family)
MWDFGRAQLLEPEALGDPGKRTFRLRIMSGDEAASLWLEKQEMAALTLAIRQLLEQTGGDPTDEPDTEAPTTPFPERPGVDFKVGRLGIGYDEGRRAVLLFAYAATEEEQKDDAPPTFSCTVTRRQCDTFARRAEEVISAGRPLCILCDGPIDPEGHDCPRRNGHHTQPVSLL